MKNSIYTIRSGAYFGDTGIGLAIGSIVLGLLAFPAGLLALPVGAYFIFTSKGIRLDLETNRLMHTVNHFGLFPSGRWQTNKLFCEIAVIGTSQSQYGSVRGAQIGRQDFRTIKIVLLDKSHFRRIDLAEAGTVEEAHRLAKNISDQTGFPLVQFNPLRINKKRRR